MHFVNNLLSVLFTLYSSLAIFSAVYFALIILAALISLWVIVRKEKMLITPAVSELLRTAGSLECYKDILMLLIPTILVALMKLL